MIKGPKSNITPVIHDQITKEIVFDTPNFINDFFSNIGETLYSKLNLPTHLFTGTDANYEELLPPPPKFTTEQVDTLCKDIDTCKPSGIHNISTKVLKDVFSILLPQITFLFNLSIELGTFPIDWAKAEVTPIPKSGDLHNVTNWRPISLLPLPSKILEKLVKQYFMDVIECHKLLWHY